MRTNMKNTLPAAILAVTTILAAGCASFRGVSVVEPPPLWAVNVSTDYLPSTMRFSAEIQSGGKAEIMRSVISKATGDFVDMPDVDAQSALVTLTPSEAAEVYRSAVRLLQRFHFQPETTPSSAHSISVRLLAGDTALEVYRGGFASPAKYPPEFKKIVRILEDHNPKYISHKELGGDNPTQVTP